MNTKGAYKICYQSLPEGRYDYSFDVNGDIFSDFENEEIRDGKLKANVDLIRKEEELICNVTIQGNVIVPCDRCLEDLAIDIDFEGTLDVRFADEEDYDGELLVMPRTEDLDLERYIYESIVISLPYQRVHKLEDCNPEMLKRFTIVESDELEGNEEE